VTLDLKLVLKAGIIWGIVGVLLIVAASFLGGGLPFAVEGLTLGTFAALFAGVHFAARNPVNNIIVDLVGGLIAGLIVAVLLIVASLVVDTGFSLQGNMAGTVGALVAGFAGALGMQVVKRIG
jgi:hypothetical protein